jgi:hypothetical protein
LKHLTFIVILLFLVGCAPELDANGESARQYLLNEEYEIKSYEGSQDYSFTQADLADMPHSSIWAVQANPPDSYIEKKIKQEIFIVENHPLSNIYGSQRGITQDVEVRVFIYKEEVIGGISIPIGDAIGGWPYSLDGRTAEEIHGEKLDQLLEKWSSDEVF